MRATSIHMHANTGRTRQRPPFRARDVESRLMGNLVDVPDPQGPWRRRIWGPVQCFRSWERCSSSCLNATKRSCAALLLWLQRLATHSCLHVCFPSLHVHCFSTSSACRHQCQAFPRWPEGRGVYQWGGERQRRNEYQDSSFLGPDSASRGPGDRPVIPPLTETACAAAELLPGDIWQPAVLKVCRSD